MKRRSAATGSGSFAAAVLLGCVCLFAAAALGQTPGSIELGGSVESDIAGGQKKEFTLAVPAGSVALLKLEQVSIDVAARVFASDGTLIFEFDRQPRATGFENIEIVSPQAATYKIEIEPTFKYAAAGRFDLRWNDVRPAAERDRSIDAARVLATQARIAERAGSYADAIAKASRGVEILSAMPGEPDALSGILTNRIGIYYFLDDDYEASAPFIKRGLALFESLPVKDDLLIADSVNNLGVLARIKGDYVEAERLLLQAIGIRERELGPDHPLVASNYNNLGLLYRNRGDYARAEQMYTRALEIRERALGKDHLDLTAILTNLASLNYYKGDLEAALTLDRRVIAIREKYLGLDHPEVAMAYLNAAIVMGDLGETQNAIAYDRHALEIFNKRGSKPSSGTTAAAFNLGNLYRDSGDFAAARPQYIEAIKYAESVFNTDPLRLANYLEGYGKMLTSEADFTEAEPWLKRSLEIRENIFGPYHPGVGAACDALARLYILKGDIPNAIKYQTRANAINEAGISQNLSTGTEHQRIAYMAMMSEGLNQTVALHLDKAAEDAAARDLAATAVIQRKGRVLDAMTGGNAALRSRLDGESRTLLDRLSDANARLAEFVLDGPKGGDAAAFQKKIAEMQETKDALDREAGKRSAGFYRPPTTVTLAAIKAAVPADAALIEFSVFKPLPSSGASNEPRYVAYIVRQKGDVKWIDLGDTGPIDNMLKQFRSSLRDAKRSDTRALGREVYEILMHRIRPLLGDAKHLLIAPDGDLSLVPFEALVDERGEFLVQSFAVTYLASGRELLRPNHAASRETEAMIIADPDFGSPAGLRAADSRRLRRSSITSTRNLSDTYFARLSGTAAEARSIRTLFPGSTYLSGTSATESALKHAAAPKFLHIATHGFFLNESELRGPRASGSARAVSTVRLENPLLRSGLALAGANMHETNRDDGILTALEASGLDLWGTRLVVLSACDTGMGEVRDGEGVYGLRRSFSLAGAESLVMSLWPVSDYVTREIMTAYYKNLKQGMGRGASLRAVQLEMLKRPNRRHPFYWASFIQSGEWANLDGKR
ncbi:MAG TPA: CHAT domain-containing tetratricopeptide repeat protein [Pyrinomonadaceae bacterium]|nr:CHAT domain-containing tetratricopeptide repeat protein [Pyrinomonadaceae bacterium]